MMIVMMVKSTTPAYGKTLFAVLFNCKLYHRCWYGGVVVIHIFVCNVSGNAGATAARRRRMIVVQFAHLHHSHSECGTALAKE